MNLFGKKTQWILVVWACLLLFGLGVELSEAQVVHAAGDCLDTCVSECSGHGGCAGASSSSCGACTWVCMDGSGGKTVCV